MNSDEIKNILKQIKYPGYSRDIISFGIVTNIAIENNNITISLKLNAEDKIKSDIQNEIIRVLKQLNSSYKVFGNLEESSNSIDVSNEIKSLKNVKNIIAIASGKGGVGKSTTSVNIASILSKDYKVGILDLDIYGPSLQMALGCDQKPSMNSNNMLLPIDSYGMKTMSFGFLND